MSQKYIPNKQKFIENKKPQKNEWSIHSVILIIIHRLQFFEATSDVNMIMLNADTHMVDILLNEKYSV